MSEEENSNMQIDEEQVRNEPVSEQAKKLPFVVPNSKTKLRACIHCKLIKTEQQWRNPKTCENCGEFNNLETETTDKFMGIISITHDGQSWVRRKKKLARNKLVLGAYAVKTNV